MAKSYLYTRTGDTGTTSLVGGVRIPKSCLRLDAYGTLDEFSSFLGAVASNTECPEIYRNQIIQVQNILFDLGAYLATEVESGTEPHVTTLRQEQISMLEKWIDSLDEATPPIHAFVLPGGNPLSSQTHIARAVCRRAERCICALAANEYVDPLLSAYINRLSDYLFILARHFNHLAGVEEIIWNKKN